jgi:hypothetical protein
VPLPRIVVPFPSPSAHLGMTVGMPAPSRYALLYTIPVKLALDLTFWKSIIARDFGEQLTHSGRSERMLIGVRVPASAPHHITDLASTRQNSHDPHNPTVCPPWRGLSASLPSASPPRRATPVRSPRGLLRARRNLPYYELVEAEIVGLKVTGDP